MSCVYRIWTRPMPRSLRKQRRPLTTFPSPWPQTMPLTPSLWPRTASSCSRRCGLSLLSFNLHQPSCETSSGRRDKLRVLPSNARMCCYILFCTLWNTQVFIGEPTRKPEEVDLAVSLLGANLGLAQVQLPLKHQGTSTLDRLSTTGSYLPACYWLWAEAADKARCSPLCINRHHFVLTIYYFI